MKRFYIWKIKDSGLKEDGKFVKVISLRNSRLALAFNSGRVIVYSLRYEQILQSFTAHLKSSVTDIIYWEKKNWIISGGEDKTIRSFQFTPSIKQTAAGFEKMSFPLCICQVDDFIFYGTFDFCRIMRWNVSDIEPSEVYRGGTGSVVGIQYDSKTENIFAAFDEAKEIVIFSKQSLIKKSIKSNFFASKIMFVPSMKELIIGTDEGYIYSLNIESEEDNFFQFERKHSDSISDLCFFEKGSNSVILSCSSGGGLVRIWNEKTFFQDLVVHKEEIISICHYKKKDISFFASVGTDNKLIVSKEGNEEDLDIELEREVIRKTLLPSDRESSTGEISGLLDEEMETLKKKFEKLQEKQTNWDSERKQLLKQLKEKTNFIYFLQKKLMEVTKESKEKVSKFVCDICDKNMEFEKELRYHSLEMEDFDLCESCYLKGENKGSKWAVYFKEELLRVVGVIHSMD